MISRGLVDRLYQTAAIQRWTDHVRPLDLTVLGKHAHMMAIAWVLGHAQLDAGEDVDWDYMISVSFLELMRKSVLTDMKSQVLEEFRKDPEIAAALDKHAIEQLAPDLEGLGRDWESAYEQHFLSHRHVESPGRHLAYRILRAASALATEWEFRLLEQANPVVADLAETRRSIDSDVRRYQYMPGFLAIARRENDLSAFVDLLGRLRFQVRWAQTPIMPVRPVLDHELLVAYLSFLSADCLGCEGDERFSLAGSAGYHAFFGALFHDLPEVLTRDIVSPIKRSIPGMDEQLGKLERKWFDSTFKPMLPRHWFLELRFMAIGEFEDKTWPPAGLSIALLPECTNHLTGFHPGALIKSCDLFCAFMEAYESIMYGVESASLWEAVVNIHDSIGNYASSGADFSQLCNCYVDQLRGRAARSPWLEAHRFVADGAHD